MTSTQSRFSIRGQAPLRILLPPVFVLVGLAVLLPVFDEPTSPEISRDGDLCPVDRESITGSAMFLFDFTKPLDLGQATLPGNLLREVTETLERNTELQVFSLTGSPQAPLLLLKRLCKTHDSADIQHVQQQEQKKQRLMIEAGCDNVSVRSVDAQQFATPFCAARDLLQDGLDSLANRQWPDEEVVSNAYLVEAFEDIQLDFAARPGPHRLYVFSDMLQHAPWYSHLELDWMDWSYDEFAKLLESHNWAFSQRTDGPKMQVEVFYVPRGDRTDQLSARNIHQDFWRNYFASARIAFRDQPSMPSYGAAPLMNIPTETEVAAQERAAIEQVLVEIRREQGELEQERREFDAERQRSADVQAQQLARRQ